MLERPVLSDVNRVDEIPRPATDARFLDLATHAVLHFWRQQNASVDGHHLAARLETPSLDARVLLIRDLAALGVDVRLALLGTLGSDLDHLGALLSARDCQQVR